MILHRNGEITLSNYGREHDASGLEDIRHFRSGRSDATRETFCSVVGQSGGDV